jgi:predicted RND superfamily exporter protein
MRRGDKIASYVSDLVVSRPGYVVVVFLLATVVFAAGTTAVSTDSGTSQFTEDLPEFDAIERVNDEFGSSFDTSQGSTQLIQTGENVLSKKGLMRMLETMEELEENPDLRVESTASSASLVAQQLDPTATTAERQVEAVERATEPEIREAVRELTDERRFTGLLSDDINERDPSASAALGTVTHNIQVDTEGGPGGGGGSMTSIQRQAEFTVEAQGGDIRVFGQGIVDDEFGRIIGDSLSIVVPAAILLILLFLIIAYRDPFDLLIAVVALVMAVVWTLGFMGLAGIPFNENLVSLPPILLAVGIDFSIHSVNRYREERVSGKSIDESMTIASDQLAVAFFIVAGTTAIGFGANLASALPPIRSFGVVAAVAIFFVLLIFGVFFPASKVLVDRFRERNDLPEFGSAPLGAERSFLGRLLPLSVRAVRPAPAVALVVFLVIAGGSAYYATGVDTTFSQEDFLPPEEQPDYIENLPGPFAPGEYTVVRELNFLEDNFESDSDAQVQMYLQGRMNEPGALEGIKSAGEDPPSTFVDEGREASYESVLTAVDALAERDEDFAAFVRRNDADGNGVPESNLDELYDRLLSSEVRGTTLDYLAEDRRSTVVVYDIESDAEDSKVTEDAREVADKHRLEAIPTGQIVLFQAVSQTILEDATRSLFLALTLSLAFLIALYAYIEGRPWLGVVNVIPVVVAVTLVGGSMRYFGIPFNAITATILAITIGLGVDYTVHTTHRFIDEYRTDEDAYESIVVTLRGTGGALTGSMLTTSTGTAVLVFAIIPIIGQFGVLTAMSVFYAYLTSVTVLPPALLVWARLFG